MEATELGRASALLSQSQELGRVLDSLNSGGKIMEMKIGDDMTAVDTQDLEYPPQMVDAIKQALQARKDAMDKELSDMGVTSVGGTQQPEPQQAAAKAAAPAQPAPRGRAR